MLLLPLLTGLALSALCPVQGAPAASVNQVKQFSFLASTRNGTVNAAQTAAKLSRPSDSLKLSTQNQTPDLSPWRAIHKNALPRPDVYNVNRTTISTNATSLAGGTSTQALSAKKTTSSSKKKKKSKSKSKKKTKTSSSRSSSSMRATSSPVAAATAVTSVDCSDVEDTPTAVNSTTTTKSNGTDGSCFPALDFQMPSSVPSSLNGWWCSPSDEYAFMGFSYEISACQSQSQLTREFTDARKTFNARYVRLYGACDDANYYDKVVNAAWEAGIGIHALVWFGFDGDDKWKTRRDSLFKSLHSNEKAKFVTRAVQFGSEPLFDWAISGTDLATQVKNAKSNLADLNINITVSEMAYGYQSQESNGSRKVLDAIDFIDAHMLPYFAQDAATGDKAWHNNNSDMNYFLSKAPNKKIYWSQTGWPSTHDCNAGVCPNSSNAVSNVKNEKAYFDLLDSKCTTLKAFPGGGVGWFAHIYSDTQEPGYGIYDYSGKTKLTFKPKTSC